MRAKHLPFQIEDTTNGTFVVQGLAGGILLGFILVIAVPMAYPHPANFDFVFYAWPAGLGALLKSRIKHNHHCLGSRFIEWREHAA